MSCPDEEGIETGVESSKDGTHEMPMSCPDEEGIETALQLGGHFRCRQRRMSCPDEEGIETWQSTQR